MASTILPNMGRISNCPLNESRVFRLKANLII